ALLRERKVSLFVEGTAEPVIPDAEPRLGSHGVAQRDDPGIHLAVFELSPTKVSPSEVRLDVRRIPRERLENADGVLEFRLVDEDLAKHVRGVAEVRVRLQRRARRLLDLVEPAIRRGETAIGRAERQANDTDEVMRL